MIQNERVVVVRPVETGRDSMNEPIIKWQEEQPVSVVIEPGTTTDLDADRPEGSVVTMTLHFQKSYTKSLRGCKVRVRDAEYSVIGDPQPYMDVNTPGLYNRPVSVKRVVA